MTLYFFYSSGRYCILTSARQLPLEQSHSGKQRYLAARMQHLHMQRGHREMHQNMVRNRQLSIIEPAKLYLQLESSLRAFAR